MAWEGNDWKEQPPTRESTLGRGPFVILVFTEVAPVACGSHRNKAGLTYSVHTALSFFWLRRLAILTDGFGKSFTAVKIL